MNITKTNDQAQDILDALRKIQDTPELQAEAKTNPEAVMNKLGLKGIARSAVAVGMLAVLVAPVSMGAEGLWA